jgi:hypothetical protein
MCFFCASAPDFSAVFAFFSATVRVARQRGRMTLLLTAHSRVKVTMHDDAPA